MSLGSGAREVIYAGQTVHLIVSHSKARHVFLGYIVGEETTQLEDTLVNYPRPGPMAARVDNPDYAFVRVDIYIYISIDT